MIKILAIAGVVVLAYVYLWPLVSGHANAPITGVKVGTITDANGKPLT